MKTILINITPDMGQQEVINAGVMYEHNSTELVFSLDGEYINEDYNYYLSFAMPSGTARSDYLTPDAENKIHFILPNTVTANMAVLCCFNIVKINEETLATELVIKPVELRLMFSSVAGSDDSLCREYDFSVNALLQAVKNGSFKGEKGDKGDTGEKGDKGDRGVDGDDSKEYVSCSKNLYNPDDGDVTEGYIFNDSGELSVRNTNFVTSGFIEVTPGKSYYSSVTLNGTRSLYMRSYCFYDGEKQAVSASGSAIFSRALSVPDNPAIKYLRFSSYSASYGGSQWQLEENAQTDYEPYTAVYKLKDEILYSNLTTVSDKLKLKNSQLSELLETSSQTLNIVDTSKLIAEYIYSDDTSLLIKNTAMVSSGPIDISGYDKVVFQQTQNAEKTRAMLFYDKDMNLLAHYSTVKNNYPPEVWHSAMLDGASVCIVPIPEGSRFFAFSTHATRVGGLTVYAVKGKNVIPLPSPTKQYKECCAIKQEILPRTRYIKSFFDGKKLVALGDSITSGYNLRGTELAWPEQTASMLNMTLSNYGIGASEVAQYIQDNNSYNPMCLRYTEMDDDADLIIVSGGTNDWAHAHTDLGQLGDKVQTTFYGALDILCRGLLTKYPGKTIMFMTPIKRFAGAVEGKEYYTPNSRGYTLKDFSDAIKEVCSFYGIPVLDMYSECSINPIIPELYTAYIPDGSHPSFAGHRLMAQQVCGFITGLKKDICYD